MRVAFITHYGELYGSNRSLLNLIDGLKDYDVLPHVIVPSATPMTAVLHSKDIPVATLPIANWTSPPLISRGRLSMPRETISRRLQALRRLQQNLRVLPRMTEQLKTWNTDVVYTNVSVTPIGAMAARIIKRPHVWHLREFNDLDFNYDYDWGRRLSRLVINQATAQVAISRAIASYYRLNTSAKNQVVIYNGVASRPEFDRLRTVVTAKVANQAGSDYTFCLVGQIHRGKGQEDAIRALALLRRQHLRVRLILAGAGNVRRLQVLAEELAVAHCVEFWGYIDDPYRAYLSADAALMCSKSEGMGRVTVEAMSASLPVIGYDNGGTSEIIENERTGLLYRGGPEMLAACMARFVNNPPWARELGKNAWGMARESFSTENYARHIYEILRSVSDAP